MQSKKIKPKSIITKSPCRENPKVCAGCDKFNSQPVLLPCNHLMCRRCMLDMVKNVMDKTKIFIPKCKTCKQPVDIKHPDDINVTEDI